MSLKQKIASWDGTSVAEIKAIYDTHRSDSSFTDTITDLSLTGECERGATWLLKAWLEDGNSLEPRQVARLYRSFNQLQHWEARLHALQCFSFMPVADSEIEHVYHFLKTTLSDQNKFVRAWAYNGLYELSQQHSGFIKETKQYFEQAMEDEAPSVKARIRNLMKQGF